MSSIVSLKIAGFRSYNPDTAVTIHFFKPLTLIWGKNGSGKTTIIECLKFITTGCLPPNSNQGRSFVMDPKIALRPEVIGQITLNCLSTGKRVPVIANRKVVLSSTNKGTKFESKEQTITINDQDGKKLTVNHHCAQIQRQIPMILGINKPILQNIVFCHQEESLWPFSDSNTLKQIFDQLFQTNTFSKYMDHIWQIHKQEGKRLKQLKVRMQYQAKTSAMNQQSLIQCLQKLQSLQKESQSLSLIRQKIQYLKKQTNQNAQIVKQRQLILVKIGSLQNQLKTIRDLIKQCKQNYLQLKNDPLKKYSRLAQIGFQLKSKIQNPQKEAMEIQIPKVNIEQAKIKLQDKEKLVETLKIQKQDLMQTINQQKNKTELNKKAFQIEMQTKRILQIYPHLKNSSEQHILQSLNNKIKYMESVFKCLNISRKQIQTIQQEYKNIYIKQPNLTQQQYKKIKGQLNNFTEQVSKLHFKIILTYKAMHKPLQNLKYSGPPQLQSKLSNIQAIIKSKNDELLKYQKMQRRKTQSNEQTIQQYYYLGIVAQQKNIHFCKQRERCNVCQRSLTQAEIKQVQKKAKQIIQKTHKAIKKLKETNSKEQPYIDPDVMIKKINEQLAKLTQQRDILKSHLPSYLENKKKQVQQKTNKILELEYKKCKISEQQFHKAKLKTNEQCTITIQQFKQFVSQYLFKIQAMNNCRQKIIQYNSIVSKNQKISKQLQELQKKKKDLKQTIQKTQNDVKYFQVTLSMYKKLQQLVKSKRGRPATSKNKQTQKQRFKNIQLAEQEYANICKTIEKQELEMRSLAISIKYTYFSGQQDEKSKKLKQQKQKIQKIDEKLQNQRQKAEQLNRLNIQYIGQKRRIQNSAKDVQYKLQKQPQNVYQIYKIRQQALEKSIKDLQNIYNAIQVSINNYHEEKMMEINNILKEVWAQVYNGDDIEYIQIQTSQDPESSKRKKLNLNYSIVMKKRAHKVTPNNIIQMKGRCSMGQKVLASVIIRLALAQSFSNNSKILALDQPTTNLDKEHIKSLASELGRLIELSQQRNLQFIIISHDMEFIQMLEEYASQYYQVFRDSNNFSLIRRRQMKELAETIKPKRNRMQIQRY